MRTKDEGAVPWRDSGRRPRMYEGQANRPCGPLSAAEGLSVLLYQLSHLISQGLLRPEFVRELSDKLRAEIQMLIDSPHAAHQDLSTLKDAMARFEDTLLFARSRLLPDAFNREEAPPRPSRP